MAVAMVSGGVITMESVDEEEEVVDAVAEQELAEPLQAPGPAPRVRPPF